MRDALFNYLCLLGWSPGDDREKMSVEELIEAFTLERIISSPGQFDMNKLLNMNGLYMAELSPTEFLQSVYDEAVKQGWGDSIESTVLFEQVAELLHSNPHSDIQLIACLALIIVRMLARFVGESH